MAIRLVAPRSAMKSTEEIQEAEAGQTEFFLATPYSSGGIQVWINGVRQYLNLDYVETGPNQITFTEPVAEGDMVLFRIDAH